MSMRLGALFKILFSLVFFGLNVFADVLPTEPQQDDDFYKISTQSDELKIMSYNLLNLFDTKHDLGKDDYSFLPNEYPGKIEACERAPNEGFKEFCLRNDWTDVKFELRLKELRHVLEVQGDLPDLFAVQEIENETVAARVAGVLGYERWLITDSPDERGVDVALFYRTEKLHYLEHEELSISSFKKEGEFKTRNILRVHFSIKAQKSSGVLAVFINHWPSQGNPTEKRLFAGKVLADAISEQRKRLGADRYFVISVGDYNVPERERPNPLNAIRSQEPGFPGLIDTYDLATQSSLKLQMKRMPPGTHWWYPQNSWERLDRIFVSRNFIIENNSMSLISESYRTIAPSLLRDVFEYKDRVHFFFGSIISGVPLKFDFLNEKKSGLKGFSDHYPVLVKLAFRP